jgi:hypothetical protein
MKNWHFSQEIIDIMFNHHEIERESKGPINLNDTILIAVRYHSLIMLLSQSQTGHRFETQF